MVYDSISRFIAVLDYEWLTVLALLIHNSVLFLIMIAVLAFWESEPQRRNKILMALLVVLILSVAIKEVLQFPRPCEEIVGKIACPLGNSFPSVHAALAFTLAVAFLNKPSYWYNLAFALIVAFTRIYLGVHLLGDIAASLVVAIIGFSVVDRIWRKYYDKGE